MIWLIGAVLAAMTLVAQPPSFEVASVKQSATATGEGRRSAIEYSPNGLTMHNAHLIDCIMWAYRIEQYQLTGGDELGGKQFEIRARAVGATSVEQLRLMLQQLLAERFKLRIRRDHKELPIYWLTVAKGGPKLPPAKADDADHHHVVERLPHVVDGSFVFPDSTLPEFAAKLSLL